MKEHKFDATNYEDIESKSAWDLYVENFRDHIWDLAPKFACDPEGGGLRVVADAPQLSEEKMDTLLGEVRNQFGAEKEADSPKAMEKTKKKKSKGLTQPPFKHRADL